MFLELIIEFLLDPELWGSMVAALLEREDRDNKDLIKWNLTGL